MSVPSHHADIDCCYRRTKSGTSMLLLLLRILQISVAYELLNYSVSTAAVATTQTPIWNNERHIASRSRNEESDERWNTAMTDYIHKFGPLPSMLRLESDETIPSFTSNSITSTITNNHSTAPWETQPPSPPAAAAAALQQQQQQQQQRERASIGDLATGLYFYIFNPTLRCRLGLPSTCLCQEADLRRAIIRAGTSFDNPTPITLCSVTITLRDSNVRNNKESDFQPIDVTNKSFFIGCQAEERKILPKLRRTPKCVISGNGQQTIFYGNPIQLFLQNVQLINGYASLSASNSTSRRRRQRDLASSDADGMGGAIHLTGGKTFIDSVTFSNNVATLGGGAIYVGPTAQLTIASANFLGNVVTGDTKNRAGNTPQQQQPEPEIEMVVGGGAIYIDGGVVIAAKGGYRDNVVDVGCGGAIYAVEASIRLEDIEFENNVANQFGGAISVHRSITQLASTTFEINTARSGNGNALYIGDDLDDAIDGSYVYCDPLFSVSFCYGFDEGTAIYEIPGGNYSNTNCQEVGLNDIFSERCPNYKP